eukprot:TRINITY_DN7714_c0_g1_i1.p1 TRINITY_DN7714_c0_g1~~TRINITY_DN7714_c0_g1_i1.p1  ORF type:complete len:250 (+),score=60.97 TRINITY_DN7714_c0_g1_i1:88-837(+)
MGGALAPAACCSTGGTCCAKSDGSNTVKVAEVVQPTSVEPPEMSAGSMKAASAIEPNNKSNDGVANGQEPEADVAEKGETYEDGSTYIGQVKNGKRDGQGVWTSPSEQYSGQWCRDQRDGQGRQAWSDGRLYEGQFSDGKFHGHGRMEWHTPNGLMVYEGQYVQDVKHGRGIYRWPDGRCYDGDWVQGKRSGEATYSNLMGEVKRGIWKDDRIDRWLEDGEQPEQGVAAAAPAADAPAAADAQAAVSPS